MRSEALAGAEDTEAVAPRAVVLASVALSCTKITDKFALSAGVMPPEAGAAGVAAVGKTKPERGARAGGSTGEAAATLLRMESTLALSAAAAAGGEAAWLTFTALKMLDTEASAEEASAESMPDPGGP